MGFLMGYPMGYQNLSASQQATILAQSNMSAVEFPQSYYNPIVLEQKLETSEFPAEGDAILLHNPSNLAGLGLSILVFGTIPF